MNIADRRVNAGKIDWTAGIRTFRGRERRDTRVCTFRTSTLRRRSGGDFWSGCPAWKISNFPDRPYPRITSLTNPEILARNYPWHCSSRTFATTTSNDRCEKNGVRLCLRLQQHRYFCIYYARSVVAKSFLVGKKKRYCMLVDHLQNATLSKFARSQFEDFVKNEEDWDTNDVCSSNLMLNLQDYKISNIHSITKR